MMRSTGIVRKLDELNRLVIPRELCNTHNLAERQAMEVFTDGDLIVLKKYMPGCIFCGTCEEVGNYKGKNICKSCLADIGKLVG